MSRNTNFFYNAFTKEDIVSAINITLKKNGFRRRAKRFHRDLSHIRPGLFTFISTRDAEIVAIVDNYGCRHEAFFIRGIHSVNNKNCRYGIGPNGEAGIGLETLVFDGDEGDVFVASDEQIQAYWSQHHDGQAEERLWQERIEPSLKFAKQACSDLMGGERLAAAA